MPSLLNLKNKAKSNLIHHFKSVQTKKVDGTKDNNQNLAEKEPTKAQNTTTSQEKADENASDAQREVKVKNIKDPKGAAAGEADDFANEAIMITGATHARELLSSQVPLFICLKLLH